MMSKTELVLKDSDIEYLAEAVRPYLTEKRYLHTIAVAEEAEALGKIFLPEKILKLKAAALLHDITKNASEKKQLQYCEEFGIIIRDSDGDSTRILHAITAAEVAKRDFPNQTDDEIISGVRWHTTGKYGMSLFDMIIYLADYIEKTRAFSDCIALRNYFYDRISCEKDKYKVLVDTMIYSFDLTIKNLIAESSAINEDTIGARNYLLCKKHNDRIEL